MTKKLIIIGVILLLVGFSVAVAALLILKDLGELGNDLISKTYEINNDFNNIDLELEEADLNIYLSNDGINKAVCLEKEKITFSVSVVDNTLKIEENNEKFIEIMNFSNPEINLFLVKDTFEFLNIEYDTGDIDIPNHFTFENVAIEGDTGDTIFSAKVNNDLDIEVSTGDISIYQSYLKNVKLEASTGDINVIESNINGNLKTELSTGKTYIKDNTILGNLSLTSDTGKKIVETCEIKGNINVIGDTGGIQISDSNSNNLTVQLSTGDCKLVNYIAFNDIKIKTSTGKVSFDLTDGKNFDIVTSTGDIVGNILSEKIFDIDSDTGDEKHPSTYSGGIFKARSSTGDIKISYS